MESLTLKDEGEDITVWSIEQLVKNFQELSKNKIYYAGIGFFKSEKAEEIKKVGDHYVRSLIRKLHSVPLSTRPQGS